MGLYLLWVVLFLAGILLTVEGFDARAQHPTRARVLIPIGVLCFLCAAAPFAFMVYFALTFSW